MASATPTLEAGAAARGWPAAADSSAARARRTSPCGSQRADECPPPWPSWAPPAWRWRRWSPPTRRRRPSGTSRSATSSSPAPRTPCRLPDTLRHRWWPRSTRPGPSCRRSPRRSPPPTGTSARRRTSSASCSPATPTPGRWCVHDGWPKGAVPAAQGLRRPAAPAGRARRGVPPPGGRGRGRVRGAGGPDPRGHHRAGPLPLQHGRRDGAEPRGAPVLHPPRAGEAHRGAARSPTPSTSPSACAGCARSRTGWGSARRSSRSPASRCRAGRASPAHPRAGARAALQPRGRHRQHRGRRELPLRHLRRRCA